jgi:hypothetical protein
MANYLLRVALFWETGITQSKVLAETAMLNRSLETIIQAINLLSNEH